MVFDQIEVFSKAQPYFYIVFVIFYPQFGNKFAFLLLSFLLGLGIDIAQQTGGIHAFATVFVAFYRNRILHLITGQTNDEYDRYNSYELSTLQWTFLSFVIILAHHIVLFLLENFKLAHITEVLISALASTVLTFIFIIFYKILFKRQNSI